MTRRPSTRWAGVLAAASLAIVVGCGIVAVRPFGFEIGRLGERPDLVVAALLLTVVIAWFAGAPATSGGWLRSAAVGALAGLAWWPIATAVALLAGVMDAVVRGSVDPLSGAGVALIWGIYATFVIGLFVALAAVPAGIVWGLAARSLGRMLRLPSAAGGSPRSRALVALLILGVFGGLGEAFATQPLEARCLDIGAGYPVDAAFSPDGNLLAVAAQTDPNEPGQVILLRWPSGIEVARWTTWVDQDIAVADDGRLYWSAWILGVTSAEDEGRDGIYTVAVGEMPAMFASTPESILTDLTWTADGLRGTTPNSHRLALVRFADRKVEVLPEQPRDEVGAFWASPDGRTTAWTEGWFGDSVHVSNGDDRFAVVVGGGDQRSIAITGDLGTIVAASWFDGTRAVDIRSGERDLILRGSQAFVTASSRGDLAWAQDDEIGHGRLCTAPLASLMD